MLVFAGLTLESSLSWWVSWGKPPPGSLICDWEDLGFSPPTGSSGFITHPVSACTMLGSASLVKANYKASPDSQLEKPGWTLFARSHKVNCQSVHTARRRNRGRFSNLQQRASSNTLTYLCLLVFRPFLFISPHPLLPSLSSSLFCSLFQMFTKHQYAPYTGVTAINKM